jgi:hypothetical protein
MACRRGGGSAGGVADGEGVEGAGGAVTVRTS